MRSLREHVTEAQQWINSPAAGDDFAINIREECLLESHVIDVTADAIVIQGDDQLLALLEQYDMIDHADLAETIRRYGAVGSSAGMGHTLGEYNGAQKPGVMDNPEPEPAEDLDPEAEGNMRELPDGRRQKRTAAGWQDISGPVAHRPGVIEEADPVQRMLELAGAVQPKSTTAIDEIAQRDRQSTELQDYQRMTPQQFHGKYGMHKGEWALQHRQDVMKDQQIDWSGMSGFDFVREQNRMLELANVPVAETAPSQPETNAAHTDPLAAKAADLAPVGTMGDPETATTIDEDDNQRGLDHAYAVYGNRQGYYAWRKSPLSPVLNIGITDPQLTGITDWDPRSIQDFVKQHMKPVNFNSLSAGIKQLILKELPLRKQDMAEGVMSDIDMDLRHIAKTARMDALVDGMRGEFGIRTQQYLQDMMDDVEQNLERRGMQNINMQTKLSMLMDNIRELYAQEDLDEAEYQGRDVPLGKPMAGDVAKFKVYVKDPKTGNVKKVNFGDKTMRIKKSNPARRRSFRARHRCENPGPKTKARYWSCRKW